MATKKSKAKLVSVSHVSECLVDVDLWKQYKEGDHDDITVTEARRIFKTENVGRFLIANRLWLDNTDVNEIIEVLRNVDGDVADYVHDRCGKCFGAHGCIKPCQLDGAEVAS